MTRAVTTSCVTRDVTAAPTSSIDSNQFQSIGHSLHWLLSPLYSLLYQQSISLEC
jgi:hypothetical protein